MTRQVDKKIEHIGAERRALPDAQRAHAHTARAAAGLTAAVMRFQTQQARRNKLSGFANSPRGTASKLKQEGSKGTSSADNLFGVPRITFRKRETQTCPRRKVFHFLGGTNEPAGSDTPDDAGR